MLWNLFFSLSLDTNPRCNQSYYYDPTFAPQHMWSQTRVTPICLLFNVINKVYSVKLDESFNECYTDGMTGRL